MSGIQSEQGAMQKASFGSDEGVETAVVYHYLMETVKLCGKSVWHFFGDLYNKVIDKNGHQYLFTPKSRLSLGRAVTHNPFLT